MSIDYYNSDHLLFVVASAGAGGHRLGRIVSCIDNVYWYADAKTNGLNPWDIFSTNLVKGKDISPYHFDRLTPKNVVPLIGERVEHYWLDKDLNLYYKQNWVEAMNLAGADNIIDSGKYLLWVLHDTPQYLLSRFPKSKIINLIDTNVDATIDRYIATTALFPITINNKSIKPNYQNDYAMNLDNLRKINPTPTYRDFWSWSNHQIPFYSTKFDLEYKKYVSSMILQQHAERIKENPEYINVTWDDLNVRDIIKYLGANSIDENYIKLLHRS